MITLTEPIIKKVYFTLGVLVIIVLTVIFLLMTFAAIFPEKFEAMGITIFHNRNTGVFADCFSDAGASVPACKLKVQKEIEQSIKGAPPDPKSLRKPRIIPFTFD